MMATDYYVLTHWFDSQRPGVCASDLGPMGESKEADLPISRSRTDLRMVQVKSSHELNAFRRQGCPHLGQEHGPIVSSQQGLILKLLKTPCQAACKGRKEKATMNKIIHD